MGLTIVFVILLITAAPMLLHRIFHYFKLKIKVRNPKAIRIIAFFAMTLYIVTVVMNLNNIYWRGFKMDSFIYTISFSIVLFIFLFIDTALMKRYYFLLASFTSLNAIAFCFLLLNCIQYGNRTVFYNSKKYRVEERDREFTFKAPKYLAPRIYKKMFLFEKRIEETTTLLFAKDSLLEFTIDEKKNLFLAKFRDSGKIFTDTSCIR
jgi:hypothetical protein